MCGVIVLVACAGKFLASALAARFCGLSWRESGALGVLMNTRGLMELIVLNIGLDLGVIGPTLFAMMVVMALVTTFMTTPILELIYPAEQQTRDILLAPQPKPAGVAAVAPAEPEPEGAGFTILLCIAFTGSGPGLVTLARTLQRRGHVSRTYGLHLVPPSDRGSFILGSGAEKQSTVTMDPLLEQASAMDLTVRPLSFVSSEPGEDICRVAEAKKADLILLGWHKPLLSQKRLGGTVYQVMKDARCDAAVFIDRGLGKVKHVLVPFLGSPHDRAALALANRVMENVGARVTILHVVEPGRERRGEVFGAREEAAQVFDEVGGARVELRVVEHAEPAEAALEESSKGYDLVVVGIGREWGLEERPFGIQPEVLMDQCPVSLMVVHRGPIKPDAA
jgi:nucleotide-binding universal stress UspA family protein